MARAGFCTACNANTWVNADGSCVNGHPATCVSGVYEAGQPQPQPLPAPAPAKKSNVVLIVIVVAVLFALMVCGILAAIAVPVFFNASDNAEMLSCYANERTVEGAAMTLLAADEGATLPEDWDGLMAEVVGPYLKKEPVCPSGGTYSLIATDEFLGVECSTHGVYPETE
jgi:hypothetical protein